MTEAEWFASPDPEAMLDFLQPNATDRKMRLFACACCRHHWKWLRCEESRRAVEEAERFADGLVERANLAAARKEARRALRRVPDSHLYAAEAAERLLSVRVGPACRQVAGLMRKQRGVWTPVPKAYRGRVLDFSEHATAKAAWDKASEAMEIKEGKQQAILLREIFGNPFRPVSLNSSWLTPEVATLANEIYEEQSLDRVPELGKLLRQAGCTAADWLAHCKNATHVRGCWVLDQLLSSDG